MGIFSEIGKAFDNAVAAVGDGANAFGKWLGDAVTSDFGKSYRQGDPEFEEKIPYWFEKHSSYRILEVGESADGSEQTVRFKDGVGNEWQVNRDAIGTEEWQKWDDDNKQWHQADFEGPLGRISQEHQEPPAPIVLTEDDARAATENQLGRLGDQPTRIATPPADPMYTLPPPPEDPEPFVATPKLGKVNVPVDTYDASGNLVETRYHDGSSTKYNHTDSSSTRTYPDGSSTTTYPNGTVDTYDASGNILETRHPDGTTTSYIDPVPDEASSPPPAAAPAPPAPPYDPANAEGGGGAGQRVPDGDGDGVPNQYGDGPDLEANGIPDEIGINPDNQQPGYPDRGGEGIPNRYGQGPDLDGNGVPDEIGINPDNQQPGYPNTPSQGDDGEGIPGLGVPYQDFIPFSPMVQDPTTGQWRNAEPGEIPGAQGGDADQLPYVVNDDGTYTIPPSQAQVQEEETIDPIPSSGPSPFSPLPAAPSGEGDYEDQEVPPLQFGNTGNFNNTTPSDKGAYEEQEVPPLQFGNTGNLQNAPDATLFEEDLFNPEAPGPTLSTDLFDPTAQGPTLDTGLIPDLAQNPHLAKMLNDNLDMAAALERNPSMFDQLKQDSALLAGETSDVTELESFRDASLEPEDVPEPDVVDQDADAMS